MDARDLTLWEGRPVDAWRRLWSVPALRIVASIGSTNDAVRHLAERGAPAWTTVIADEQTAGRGRRGRRWHAPPRTGLLISVLVRPPAASAPWLGTLPLRAGLAAIRAVAATAPVRAGLKWPNDLLVDGRKLCGVLCEAATAGAGAYVVVGIGINVALRLEELPPELRERATSLRILTGAPVSRAALAGRLFDELRGLAGDGFGPLEGDVAAELAARDLLHARPLQAADGAPLGVGAGFAADGALRVLDADGRTRYITEAGVADAGVRPAARASTGDSTEVS